MTPEELRAEPEPLKDRLRAFQSIIGLSAQGWRLMEDTIETLDLLDAANAEVVRLRGVIDEARSRFHWSADSRGYWVFRPGEVVAILDQKEGK